jgi:hypothetical protein
MKSTLRFLLLAVITAEVVAGCGGDSSAATSNSTPVASTPTPTAITGVSTPHTVSVVTAN